MTGKNVILGVFIIAIIGAIFYLESLRLERTSGEDAEIKIEAKQDKANKYESAKELIGIQGFVNSGPFKISDQIGKKVILIDFWTYSCINCQRTTPYLNAWWEKYEDDGLLIIGVHTPEFEFEKKYDNVLQATQTFGIKYPVVQDNNYSTWTAYGNRYWPRKYLIDIDGFIVYDHIGEGGYEETEQKIQELLEERKNALNEEESIDTEISKPNITNTEFQNIGTPEIYFGYGFSRNQIGNEEGWQPDQVIFYSIPENIEGNKFYLNGSWTNNNDNMELQSDSGKIKLKYYAKNINLVAGSNDEVNAKIYINDEYIKNVKIKNYDLYELYFSENYGENTIEIIFENPGIMAYTFTFG